MANSNAIYDGQAETLDMVVGTDGTVYLKAAGDSLGVPTGNSDPAAPQIVQQVKAGTGTTSNVASSASSVTILAANLLRKGATVYNDSTQILYLKLMADVASATSYTVQLPASAYFEVPFSYRGDIRGIWASANGNARVTELT